MKKLLAIVLALMLCVGVLSVAAFAANETTVHVAVPADWTAPNLYTWPTGGDGAVAWPGTPLTKGDGQWYTGVVTVGEDNLIINDNGRQTADLPFDGGYEDLWVVVDASGNGTIYYAEPDVDAPAAPGGNDQPAGDVNAADPNGQFKAPASLAIVGTGIPGVGDWDPANTAGEMYVVSENVYEIDIACPAGTSMTFKFAGNDAWDDTCNLGSGTAAIGSTTDLVNDGGSSDMNLTVDKNVVLKFTVDLTALANGTGAATLTIAETEGEVDVEPAPAPVEVTVYARANGWGAPNLYTWPTGGDGAVAWPGTPMTQEGDWYVGKMPAGDTNLIINDGSAQTADLAIEAGKDTVWVDVVDGVGTVYYEEPAAAPQPTEPAPTEPAPTETQPQESTPAEETQPTAPAAPDKSPNKTTSILVIALVFVWIVFAAMLISVFVKKR